MPITALRTISAPRRQSCQPHTSFLPFSSILQFDCMAETLMCPDLHSNYCFGDLAANLQPLLQTSLLGMAQVYRSASHQPERAGSGPRAEAWTETRVTVPETELNSPQCHPVLSDSFLVWCRDSAHKYPNYNRSCQ